MSETTINRLKENEEWKELIKKWEDSWLTTDQLTETLKGCEKLQPWFVLEFLAECIEDYNKSKSWETKEESLVDPLSYVSGDEESLKLIQWLQEIWMKWYFTPDYLNQINRIKQVINNSTPQTNDRPQSLEEYQIKQQEESLDKEHTTIDFFEEDNKENYKKLQNHHPDLRTFANKISVSLQQYYQTYTNDPKNKIISAQTKSRYNAITIFVRWYEKTLENNNLLQLE